MSPRVLLLLSQMPQDPSSGAPRSMRNICEYLAAAGMEVAAVATTAREAGGEENPIEFLRQAVGRVEVDGAAARPKGGEVGGEVLRFVSRGISYHLLNTEGFDHCHWEASFGAAFDALLDRTLDAFRPDIVFTYGGSPAEMARRKRARGRGCRIVFGLRNLSYLAPGAFEDVDAILTGSAFVSRRYREVLGIDSTPLPLPMNPEEVVAAEHERIFVTYVNPSLEKGVLFAATLFEELSIRRPDIPILVIESRGHAGVLVAAGLSGGFDLRRHENLMVGTTVPRPAEIYRLARVVLAPSVWEEPAGRVAAEALANGIPPIVSDRGGLPEVAGDGGFVLPLPADLTIDTRRPVPREAVSAWAKVIERVVDDEGFYAEACARAARAGERCLPPTLARRYVEFFQRVHDGGR